MASVLYALAGKLAGELCSPLFNNYVGKPWELGTKSEFQKLNNTVSAIQAVLLDAEEKQNTNHQVRDWLIKIKLVFYDIEDLMQEVTYEALKRQVKTKNKKAKKVQIFFSRSNQLKYRFKIGRKVKLIREQLDAISSDSNRFSLAHRHEEMRATTTNHTREETHSFVPVDKFIGRDADRKHVTDLLLESDGIDSVSVISIVGIGGMGKTTLAQSIYSSEEVKANFELIKWVCVSDTFDVKLICENIIKSVTHNQCEGLPMDVVKDKLKRLIDGQKYLLVLDDVWNDCPDEWMKLEVLLNCGAKGSKILITARSELVSRAANSVATYVLKGLSHNESWALFKQVACKRVVDPTSSTIIGTGNEVVKVCAGVPLALRTIGSMLGQKERESDWGDFKKNVLPTITKDNEGKIVPILKLSYDNLPARLKRCFAYCAMFPKDWVIGKDMLIRMWMAIGLIQLDGTTRSLEDVGENYFMDLVDRSLFEVYRKNDDGTILSFKMHDLIHDLALSVGENEFWSSGSDVNCIDVRTRHAWFTSFPCISTNLLHAKKLRSLRFRKLRDNKDDVIIFGELKQLRVLDFTYLGAARVMDFLDSLRFLNYLDLSRNKFDSLPESICSMYNLQTLILSYCEDLNKLPTETRNLVNLRHLKINGCRKLSHMPCGLGELTSLRTLTDFVMGAEGTNCSELGELKSLVNLRGELRIRNLRGSKVAKCRNSSRSCYLTPLVELKFIQKLWLEWSDEDEVDREEDKEEAAELEILKPHPNLDSLNLVKCGDKRFPSWMDRDNIGDSLPNIRSIRLERCKGWRFLPPLWLLPSLRELYLWNMGDIRFTYDKEADEDWNNNNNRYFPALEKLRISNCPLLVADGRRFLGLNRLHEVCLSNIDTLPGWLQSLPHLQTLELSFCMNMVTLPEWMGDHKSLLQIRLIYCGSLTSIPNSILTSLQRLEIQKCGELYRRYNKECGVDWHKIAHIPNVSVTNLWFYDL